MKFKEINIKNRRATFDYAIGDTFTAGLVLTGTEIKSIRQGKASLADTFCYVNNGEVWVKNMYIRIFLRHLQQPYRATRPQTAAEPKRDTPD